MGMCDNGLSSPKARLSLTKQQILDSSKVKEIAVYDFKFD